VIFFKNAEGKKELVHTLNATGIAIPRALIAIMENYQQKDGSILIPKILRKYLGNLKIIKRDISVCILSEIIILFPEF
jgi:seryl-tRNA synthetase